MKIEHFLLKNPKIGMLGRGATVQVRFPAEGGDWQRAIVEHASPDSVNVKGTAELLLADGNDSKCSRYMWGEEGADHWGFDLALDLRDEVTRYHLIKWAAERKNVYIPDIMSTFSNCGDFVDLESKYLDWERDFYYELPCHYAAKLADGSYAQDALALKFYAEFLIKSGRCG